MKKEGKKVEERIQKNEQERKALQLKNFIEIRYNIQQIEKEFPNRGACVCIWDNIGYAVKNNMTIPVPLPAHEVKSIMEYIKTIENKSYYIFNENLYKEHKKLLDWLAEHYANIKIALVAQTNNQCTAKDRLYNLFSLGNIWVEFQKEFPGKDIFYLKEGIAAYDEMLRNLH